LERFLVVNRARNAFGRGIVQRYTGEGDDLSGGIILVVESEGPERVVDRRGKMEGVV
jgi:hypothetical protein